MCSRYVYEIDTVHIKYRVAALLKFPIVPGIQKKNRRENKIRLNYIHFSNANCLKKHTEEYHEERKKKKFVTGFWFLVFFFFTFWSKY